MAQKNIGAFETQDAAASRPQREGVTHHRGRIIGQGGQPTSVLRKAACQGSATLLNALGVAVDFDNINIWHAV